MPEGHSVHRIARQFRAHFVGHRVQVSSPQGRFAEGARMLNGLVMTDARAVGKQMFLEFDSRDWLRVHLGIYGAWDFAGDIFQDATTASAGGRMGQTNQRGTVLADEDAEAVGFEDLVAGEVPTSEEATEASGHSIGAPRRSRVRMAETEQRGDNLDEFPPPPVGQVRVRLLADAAVADLRGPTACEVLTSAEVQAVIARLGPDPQNDSSPEAEAEFVRRLRKSGKPVAALLMDQSVVAGIGNVYRAEILFRARLDPYLPGSSLTEEQARALWADWVRLLAEGVRTGQMMTMDGLGTDGYRRALASRADRHWVYRRSGEPCRVCGSSIQLAELAARKLYWCPRCQG